MRQKLQFVVHRVGDVLCRREVREAPFRHAFAQGRGDLAADLRIEILALNHIADGGDAFFDLGERQRLRERCPADEQRARADDESYEEGWPQDPRC